MVTISSIPPWTPPPVYNNFDYTPSFQVHDPDSTGITGEATGCDCSAQCEPATELVSLVTLSPSQPLALLPCLSSISTPHNPAQQVLSLHPITFATSLHSPIFSQTPHKTLPKTHFLTPPKALTLPPPQTPPKMSTVSSTPSPPSILTPPAKLTLSTPLAYPDVLPPSYNSSSPFLTPVRF